MRKANSMRTLAVVAFCASVVTSIAAHAANIDRVIVRQQWPWSTDVKVEYRITGVTSPVDVSIAAYDGETPLDSAKIAAATKGDIYGIRSDGDYSFTIDPVAAFGAARAAIPKFNVALSLSDSAPGTADVLYKIIDLDTFTATDVTRGDFMGGKMGSYETSFSAIGDNYWTALTDVLIWTGVTNVPAYKTSKLVMRKIPAKNVTFGMGKIPGTMGVSGTGSIGSMTVTLTNDFYISVFEITEGQYKRMTAVNGTLGSSPTSTGDEYPVRSLKYNDLRGDPVNWTDWPDDQHCVASGTAIAKLRANMPGYLFDLPTEAQWEYACRAGTTNDLYIGYKTVGGDTGFHTYLAPLAWYSSNSDSQPHLGGMKRPNALGLYDMLGNVCEHTRDLIAGSANTSDKDPPVLSGEATEPYGMAEGTDARWSINVRGGGYSHGTGYCTVYSRRHNTYRSTGNSTQGLRLWLRAE